MTGAARVEAAVPARAGVGLKAQHHRDLLEGPPRVGFVEIHAENHMGAGGAPHHWLGRVRERYPVSLHGVGLSIGGEAPLDVAHLARLRALADRYEPGLFSEHLAWSSHDGVYLADLLPVAYDAPTLARVCAHIDQVQTVMGRRMLLENPSTYVAFERSTFSEVDFLREVVRATGCGLLLDVNNVHVSAVNHGRDALAYLRDFPMEAVGEIHLAGFAEDRDAAGDPLLIDAHGTPVDEKVWSLFAAALARVGPVPSLIEWDNDVPSFDILAREAARADAILARFPARPAGLAA